MNQNLRNLLNIIQNFTIPSVSSENVQIILMKTNYSVSLEILEELKACENSCNVDKNIISAAKVFSLQLKELAFPNNEIQSSSKVVENVTIVLQTILRHLNYQIENTSEREKLFRYRAWKESWKHYMIWWPLAFSVNVIEDVTEDINVVSCVSCIIRLMQFIYQDIIQ